MFGQLCLVAQGSFAECFYSFFESLISYSLFTRMRDGSYHTARAQYDKSLRACANVMSRFLVFCIRVLHGDSGQ